MFTNKKGSINPDLFYKTYFKETARKMDSPETKFYF